MFPETNNNNGGHLPLVPVPLCTTKRFVDFIIHTICS